MKVWNKIKCFFGHHVWKICVIADFSVEWVWEECENCRKIRIPD